MGLRIAILGTRGIPARYGGFETFAEELSKRLVARGHAVTVYGRRSLGESYNGPSELYGVQVRVAPTVAHKYLETPLHAFTSNLDLMRRKFDVGLVCNAANSPFAWMIRLRGVKLIVNLDGIERRRGKWNVLGKTWYRLGELCSVLFAHRLVADAAVISEYYRKTYRAGTTVIAYGADGSRVASGKTLAEFALQQRRYLLYVSRLEPENNAFGVIQAYALVDTDVPLVIVGDAPYSTAYKERLKRESQHAEQGSKRRVVFTGYRFGDDYRELQSNCYLYIQATEVGGTHPALVEAMAFGNCVVANDTPEHLEVLGDTGMYYGRNDFSELGRKMSELLADPQRVRALGAHALRRASERYTWEKVTDQYEALFSEVCGLR